ncbi:MAG: hypothetical protein GXP31_09045 [Kiritimatiellaeota bacterium]|nr:hypothetical protein [Kiritimatiellota bacterium]
MAAGTLPGIEVTNIRKVFDDANHNAFTDLCRFGDRFYLTFRSCPDGHGIFRTSRILVLSSADGKVWAPAFHFSVPDRDVRDPHFLIFRNTLFVYTGTWLADPDHPVQHDLNDHLGYGAWSADGTTWSGPRMLEGTYGHYVWRAASHGDRALLCGRRKREFAHRFRGETKADVIQSLMLESEDGLVWRAAAFFAEDKGDETAFLFEDDGSVLAVVRGPAALPARVCRSRPPYREWRRVPLDRNVGGPLLVKWNGHCLVGGRKTAGPNNPVTTLYWLVGDNLEEICELPSAGDNSYPGFVQTGETTALLSYYSTHEPARPGHAGTAIYLANLTMR